MDRTGGGRPLTLTSPERDALRAVLVGTTRRADACHESDDDRRALERWVRVAPMDRLPEAAVLHRVVGAVHRGLEGVDGVRPDVRAQLEAICARTRLRQLIFLGALSEIGHALDTAALPWAVMKGPVLAVHLYPDTADRVYGDLDLLVPRRCFPEAVRVLEDLGFRHDVHNWARAEEQLAGEITMRTDTVVVDLHWNLHYDRVAREPFDLRPEEMLDRTREVSLGALSVATFDPTDTLIALCFHAARSDGHRLVWFKDIERSLSVDHPDLDETVRRSRSFRIAPLVGLMLARTRRILGAPVPDEVVASLASPALLLAERRVCALVDPIQFHEDGTFARLFTRSIRPTDLATLGAIPARAAQVLERKLFPPRENETDDEEEKESYFRAVVGST
jgi:hypothetical protein